MLGLIFFLINLITILNGQFLTPDQLREQYEMGYSSRTHYELSGSRRTDMFDRVNPDYLLRGSVRVNICFAKRKIDCILGFFPFWSMVLICFAFLFLTLAVIGVIGYLLGCRRPSLEELYANEFEQLTPDEEFLLGAGGGGISNLNDTKILLENTSHGYFDTYRDSSRYESLQPIERTRIGQSHEDMV